MTESRESRIERLAMRSWRRGIKEMDLILGGFADAELAGLDAATLCVRGRAPHDMRPRTTKRVTTQRARALVCTSSTSPLAT